MPFSGRTELLSPFDRLVHDRKRVVERFSKTAAAAVRRELKDLALWPEVDLLLPG